MPVGGRGSGGALGMLLLLGVSLPLFQEPLSPPGELLLTSGITLHVQIFVKTAVQHKGKRVE